MPQLIALALVGVGAYAGYKYITKQVRRMADEAEQRTETASRAGGPRDQGELEWDAEAGVYRPRRS